MTDINQALKLLACAEVNCDDIASEVSPIASAFVQIVKSQIQDAIRSLGGEIHTEDPMQKYREEK